MTMAKKNLFLMLTIALVLSGCYFPMRTTRVIGSGQVVTQTRRITNFSAVELSGIGTLMIEQGDVESLEITAEDNVIDYLKSDKRGKTLVLGVQEFVSIEPREEIIYRLTVKELERIETSGLGNIQIAGLETDTLDLQVSGSGNVKIDDLRGGSFKLEISGLGNITVAGRVAQQRVELSGAGNYDAGDLYCEDARIQISGTGRAMVWAAKTLDIEISGMGALQYYGSPTLNTEMSGVGSVESLGEK
jgi:hypothetical protein